MPIALGWNVSNGGPNINPSTKHRSYLLYGVSYRSHSSVATVVEVVVYAITTTISSTTISSVTFAGVAGGFHVSWNVEERARASTTNSWSRAPSTSPAGARFVSSNSRSKERRAVARPDFSAPPVADRGRPANRFSAVAAVYIMYIEAEETFRGFDRPTPPSVLRRLSARTPEKRQMGLFSA